MRTREYAKQARRRKVLQDRQTSTARNSTPNAIEKRGIGTQAAFSTRSFLNTPPHEYPFAAQNIPVPFLGSALAARHDGSGHDVSQCQDNKYQVRLMPSSVSPDQHVRRRVQVNLACKTSMRACNRSAVRQAKCGTKMLLLVRNKLDLARV